MRIDTAAWSIPRNEAASFGGEGTHLQRYARVLDCCEINTSFYRSHRVEVYQKWAAQTPPGFRFAVKLPRTITHDARLRRAREPLGRFLGEVAGLGDRLGVLLAQLPPSQTYEARPVRNFFGLLADAHQGPVVVEPRHASWFTEAAGRALNALRVSRAAADPALGPAAERPGGWLGAVSYYRWHGSPRMYWSGYTDEWLKARADQIAAQEQEMPSECWCIFDNTAGGKALSDAMSLHEFAGTTSRVR